MTDPIVLLVWFINIEFFIFKEFEFKTCTLEP